MNANAKDPIDTSHETDASFASRVRRGLAWGFVGTLVLRLGSLSVGIALARLLDPQAFGVYAIALTVQGILMTLADLGLSADLVHARNPEERAPTVATLSLASGVLLAGLMSAVSVPLAISLGSSNAAPVIVALSLTLVLASAGVVPFAVLQRNFEQKKLFATSAIDFVVGTTLTIVLVVLGMGPMALAVGRIAAQSSATVLQFVLARVRPRFGMDRAIARSALSYGMPLAGANLLSWFLLNLDNVVIARVIGDVALGLYVLAFNISSWPMNAIGTAIRSVALSAFSRTTEAREDAGVAGRDPNLPIGAAFAWAAALPAGALLAALALPLIHVLYGDQWVGSAEVLAALGVFGALRVLFDLMATYLMARGASRTVLVIQLVWVLALAPALVIAARFYGIAGAGWVHVFVGLFVILPAYCIAVWRVGADLMFLCRVLWPPVAASIPAFVVAVLAVRSIESNIAALLVGGTLASLVYCALLYRWLLGMRRLVRAAVAKPPPLDPRRHVVPFEKGQIGSMK